MSKRKDTALLVSAVGLIAGFVEKLVAKFKALGGAAEQLYELLVGSKSEEFIAKVCDLAMSMTKTTFPVWKTVTAGAHQSAEAWIKALTSAGFKVSDWGKDLLSKIAKYQPLSEVSFIKATLAELGFTKPANIVEIIARIKELGYAICEPGDAPFIRLAYKDQPYGEWIYIAMEPVRDSVGHLKVFGLYHHGVGMWLSGFYAYPDFTWSPVFSFLFRFCK